VAEALTAALDDVYAVAAQGHFPDYQAEFGGEAGEEGALRLRRVRGMRGFAAGTGRGFVVWRVCLLVFLMGI
jgi:hypothetical protein